MFHCALPMLKQSANMLNLMTEALMWIAGGCKSNQFFQATSRNATEHNDLPKTKLSSSICFLAMLSASLDALRDDLIAASAPRPH